jgi:hypothetical protein
VTILRLNEGLKAAIAVVVVADRDAPVVAATGCGREHRIGILLGGV